MLRNKMMRTGGEKIRFIGSNYLADINGNWSIPVPSATESGDIAVLFYSCVTADTSFTFNNPMTSIYDGSTDASKGSVYVRTMTGSETTLATVDGSSFFSTFVILMIYRGCDEPSASDMNSDNSANTWPEPPASIRDAVLTDFILVMGMFPETFDMYTPSAGYRNIEGTRPRVMAGELFGVMGSQSPSIFTGDSPQLRPGDMPYNSTGVTLLLTKS